MTKASLVVPTRGGAKRLPILLEALAQQTHDDWEAIIVVDGEVDSSADVVQGYEHLPLRSIVFPQNRGRVTALNAGFEAAEGEIFIRCDDDFEPGPGHIAAHVAAHEKHECGAIGLPLNVAPHNAYTHAYGYDADVRSRTQAYATDTQERWRLWGGNTSTSRETFVRLGGFDAGYKGYGWEDLDFGYRVHRLGLPIDLLPQAEVRHHTASVNTVERVKRAYRSGQARAHFDTIHGEGASGPAVNPSSPWNRAVVTLAKTLNDDRAQRLARIVDDTLPLIPKPVGRTIVALAVESSAAAGFGGADHA